VLTGPRRSATKPTTARPMHTEKPSRVVGLRAGQPSPVIARDYGAITHTAMRIDGVSGMVVVIHCVM
jgi:hypothetical protein